MGINMFSYQKVRDKGLNYINQREKLLSETGIESETFPFPHQVRFVSWKKISHLNLYNTIFSPRFSDNSYGWRIIVFKHVFVIVQNTNLSGNTCFSAATLFFNLFCFFFCSLYFIFHWKMRFSVVIINPSRNVSVFQNVIFISFFSVIKKKLNISYIFADRHTVRLILLPICKCYRKLHLVLQSFLLWIIFWKSEKKKRLHCNILKLSNMHLVFNMKIECTKNKKNL